MLAGAYSNISARDDSDIARLRIGMVLGLHSDPPLRPVTWKVSIVEEGDE